MNAINKRVSRLEVQLACCADREQQDRSIVEALWKTAAGVSACHQKKNGRRQPHSWLVIDPNQLPKPYGGPKRRVGTGLRPLPAR